MSWLGVALPDGSPAFVSTRVTDPTVYVTSCHQGRQPESVRVSLRSRQPVGPCTVVCARAIADPVTALFAVPHTHTHTFPSSTPSPALCPPPKCAHSKTLWLATTVPGTAAVSLWSLEGELGAPSRAFVQRVLLGCPPLLAPATEQGAEPRALAACELLDGLFFVALQSVADAHGAASGTLAVRCDCWHLYRASSSSSGPAAAGEAAYCAERATRIVRFVAQSLLHAPSVRAPVGALCQLRAFDLAYGRTCGVVLLAPQRVQRARTAPAVALAPAAVFVAALAGAGPAPAPRLREVPAADTWDATDARWALPPELLHGRVAALQSLWVPPHDAVSPLVSSEGVESEDCPRFVPPTATLAVLADGAGVLLRGEAPLAAVRPGTLDSSSGGTLHVHALDADGAVLVCAGRGAWVATPQHGVRALRTLAQPAVVVVVTPAVCLALDAQGTLVPLLTRPVTLPTSSPPPAPAPAAPQQEQQDQQQKGEGQDVASEAALCAPFEACLEQTEAAAAGLVGQVEHLRGLLAAVAPPAPAPVPASTAFFVAVDPPPPRQQQHAHALPTAPVVLAPGIVAHCVDAAAAHTWLVRAATALSPDARAALAQRLGAALGAARAVPATDVPPLDALARAERLLAAAETNLHAALSPAPAAASAAPQQRTDALAAGLLDVFDALFLFSDLSSSSSESSSSES